MSSLLLSWAFKFLARLPLCVLHGFGHAAGWLTYFSSGKYAARLRENLRLALADAGENELKRIQLANIAETGKSLLELPWVWLRPLQQVTGSVHACHGWEHVEAARSQGKGIIFLTPHLGCFEISALYAAERMPITVLYRPPRLAWLEDVMREGRERAQLHLARTDVSGVRSLYKALKRGEAIGLLPDQVPGKGEGEWIDFFGRPAYTMTLVGRLADSCNAAILMAYAERLPTGKGYVIHIAPLVLEPESSPAKQINAALENTIRACPTQYLWSYNRYKPPVGGTP